MDQQDNSGKLRRKRRRLAQKHEDDKEDGAVLQAISPSPYGFLHLLSLIVQHDIPVLFPGSERPRNAYGLLGSGASFLVFKEERSMDTLPIIHGERRSLENKMVLKRTRQYTDLQNPAVNASSERYRSIVAELQVLLDPLVQANENIIDLHGLTWDYEPDDDDETSVTVWPVLALEAAECSMQSLKLEFDLSDTPLYARLEYCHQIASGLEFLHSRGVVHSDVKLENILICVTERSGSVAKICDFGSAILDVSEESYFPRGIAGTPPWTSPEFRSPLRGAGLFLTDVYSFGMLLWRFLSSPSSLTNLDSLGEVELRDRIETLHRLKHSNGISDVAVQELQSIKDEIPAMEIVSQILRRTLALESKQRPDMVSTSSYLLQALNEALKRFTISTPASAQEDELSTEALNASDMNKSRDETDSESSEDIPWKIFPVDTEPFFTEFEKVYEVLEDEAPSVKRHIVRCLENYADRSGVAVATSAEAAYQLVLCHVNGFGMQKSLPGAHQWILRAARLGNLKAKEQAYSFLEQTSFNELDLAKLRSEAVEWLQAAVKNGSASAVQVLQTLDPELCEKALDDWNKRFFDIDEILKLDQYLQVEQVTPDMPQRMASGITLDDRGNQYIHYAAVAGNLVLLERLQRENVSMDDKNAKGESALLCACRSNQTLVALYLLSIGAKIDPAASGESPLHWLICIDKDQIPTVASALVAAGADIEQQYQVTESNDLVFDIYPHGTPLDWAISKRELTAISTLIELGANPFNEQSRQTAFARAASAHDWEILQILLASKHATRDNMSKPDEAGNSILFEAIYCYPTYDRLMLHGKDLKSAAVKTVQSLIDAGCQTSRVDESGSSMLHVLAGFCTKDFIQWLFDDFDLVRYINVKVGEFGRTPIHNAIAARNYEVFEFLLSSGADLSVEVQGLTVLHLLALIPDQDFTTKCLDAMQLRSRQDLNSRTNMPDGADDLPGGMTPFELAVHAGNLKVASILLEAGALPSFDSHQDLHFIALLVMLPTWTSIESLGYYLEKVECPFIIRKSTSLSVLHVAAGAMQPIADVTTGQQKLDILLGLFPDAMYLDARTTSSSEPEVAPGQTPLHYAAKFGVSYAVDKLLSAGADPEVKDDNGNSPLDLARLQILSLESKGLDQRHPQIYAELQSTVQKLQGRTKVTASILKDAIPKKIVSTIRSRLSNLGFEIV